MEPQSKVRKKDKRPGGRDPGSRRKSKCWRWARKIKRSQSQGVAGGAKACKRGRTQYQGSRHDATAMQLPLRAKQESR
ncbi:hypothetical protein FOQG_09518 [Fusarium oxysporum f. sp. raphani 54005]|uniref:Uncharacterized protein n=8 Tax=Fusarium oxysporum TaxID=5507 RepID=W9ILR5_FUSOX|nr:hypothetical protein FOXG_17926 [Fusarium oxysporum f. sp. lycopersici 4287]EWY93441.1 hypothetical protein FOYG_06648 [Fusarium oxysporum NRRL 32931]EWZ51256.1 hypothetical protein FOZG_01408 [Fusarium oxysporum Fo47]EWZ91273.1 hypothetical protein FOWG_06922 [Fusarium oxysporum f. sp. lycopersici MN25]EXA52525.1 hypothetical protein FOVG_00781 [Fusarium oxysporum f. sp. pisi HDV247]EXK48525.1 hypothetical protein FOMG_01414 [Fusarium oxysporum f. sp. melonis 26406]EXK86659.1 hypothetical